MCAPGLLFSGTPHLMAPSNLQSRKELSSGELFLVPKANIPNVIVQFSARQFPI
jgi:hypothetical protein